MSKYQRRENEPKHPTPEQVYEFWRNFLICFSITAFSCVVLAIAAGTPSFVANHNVKEVSSFSAFNLAYDSAEHNEHFSWDQMRRIVLQTLNSQDPSNLRHNHVDIARVEAVTDATPIPGSGVTTPPNKRIIIENGKVEVADWQQPLSRREPGTSPQSQPAESEKQLSYEHEVYEMLNKLGLYALRASYVYDPTVVSLSQTELDNLRSTDIIPETFTPVVCTYNVTMIGEKGPNQRASLSLKVMMNLIGKNTSGHGPSLVKPGMSYEINSSTSTEAQVLSNTVTTVIEGYSNGTGTVLTPQKIEAYQPLIRECTTWKK